MPRAVRHVSRCLESSGSTAASRAPLLHHIDDIDDFDDLCRGGTALEEGGSYGMVVSPRSFASVVTVTKALAVWPW
jgi:hypothetical protein